MREERGVKREERREKREEEGRGIYIKKLTSVREISFRGSERQGAGRRRSEASVLPYEG